MDFAVGQVDFPLTCGDGQVEIGENIAFTSLFSSGQVICRVTHPDGHVGVNSQFIR